MHSETFEMGSRQPPHEGLPSIAVLPFQNLSGEQMDDYFADGIVEDIIISLARLRELLVICRGSTLAYRGPRVDLREVRRALEVRYVLEGRVRRSPKVVHVSMQLLDTDSGARLWADTAEVTPSELFKVQDEIVERVVAQIAPNVRAVELRAALRKRPESFSAYDWMLRGLHIMNMLDIDHFLRAREFLNQAMAEDPNFAMPVAWAARWHSLYIGQGWSANPTQDAATAGDFAARAIKLDGQNALALATYGHVKSFLFHDCESALPYFDRALAACPNSSVAWLLSSGTLSYMGRGEEAIKHAKHALRLSPVDRSLFYYYHFLNLAYYAGGYYEEAVKWGRMARNENPMYTGGLRYLAASLTAVGRIEETREVAAQLRRLEPEFRLGRFARIQPFWVPELGSRYIEHLRKAGLPE